MILRIIYMLVSLFVKIKTVSLYLNDYIGTSTNIKD